jgi:hypothetical protein
MTLKVLNNLREKIKAQIDVADEEVLKQINSILVPKRNKNDVVAYTIKGKPVTRKELESELLLAEKEIRAGNFITMEELENKFK